MEFIQQNIFLVLLAALSGVGWLVLTLRGGGGNGGLTPTQATLLINREDAQVIDVRESGEYASGHLPESRNIPLGQLEARAAELNRLKDKQLILVCQNGARAGSACKQLQKLGFGQVDRLAGGISGWRAAGLLLHKGADK